MTVPNSLDFSGLVNYLNSATPNHGGVTNTGGTSTPPPNYALSTQGAAGSPEYTAGNGLLSTLSLPAGLSADKTFTWQVDMSKHPNGPIRHDDALEGYNPNLSTLTQMTMAGAMSWLRDLAAKQAQPGGDYDAIVHQLVAAGYLTPEQARYGGFTTTVANAFLQSAADVWNVNQRSETGQLMTWGDNINGLINGRMAAGQIDANGMPLTGGSGPQAPTRTDRYTSPEDVKYAINNAAENILGRKLNDKEIGVFQSLYHGLEAKSNDQIWSQQMATFNNQSSTPNTAPAVTTPPSTSAEAQNYLDSAGGALGQERDTQLLGSYVGILRNMTGLGAGGISHAVN